MAKMHPAVPEADAPEGERYTFARLRDSLPADWSVVHARRLVIPAAGTEPPFEGEVDFVVMAPRRGVLVLEVKGGGIERRGNEWFSTDRHGASHRIRDPGRQASRAAHALFRYFESKNLRGPVSWGVVFPDVDVRADLGPDLPRALIVDRDDFADLKNALQRVWRAHGRDGTTFDTSAQKRAISLLAPSCRLMLSLARKMDDEAEVLLRLTEEQALVLDHFERMRRCAVEGAAGTGKTVLALEKARRCARAGMETLLLCFNRALAAHLATLAPDVRVCNFHTLCRELAEAAGLPFRIPREPARQRNFWATQAPELLLQACAASPEPRFDAIIVDEGQDFLESWWIPIDELLRDPTQSTLYVFYDPNQNIYGGKLSATVSALEIPLRWNCRNTARIAEFAASQVGARAELRPGAPEGAKVIVETCDTSAAMVEAVRRNLHWLHHENRVQAEQIVVLSTRSTNRSALKNARKLANLDLVGLDAKTAPNQVRFTSLHQFKGLESDVVILVDVEEGAINCSPQHLYVGASRARHLLIVLKHAP